MEPPLEIRRTLLPVPAHDVEDAEISKENKELCFNSFEQTFLNNKSENTLLGYLCLLLYACEYERLKKVIDDHPAFKDFTDIFRGFYSLKHGKLMDCASLVNRYLRVYAYSAEAMFLAASLQSLVKTPIAYDVNFGTIALLHYFRNEYEAALTAYEKMPLDCRSEWIKVLIDVAERGYTPETVAAINTHNLPRCAIIALLNLGLKSEQLEYIAEEKIKIYPYDFTLRDCLMSYYALHGYHGRALLHYDLFEKGEPPGDTFHVKAAFNLKLGRISLAREILDNYVPTSLSCYEKLVKLYKQIPESKNNVKKVVVEGLKRFPKSTFLLMERVYILLEQEGVSDRYQDTIDQILKIFPHHNEALLRKAASASTFKGAKKYLTVLEQVYPDCDQTLKIGAVIRYEFGEEISRALSDVETLRKRKSDFQYEKLYVDILIYLERYEEVISEAFSASDEFRLLYKFRVIICFLRSNNLDKAAFLLRQYEEIVQLSTHELSVKGELLVAQKNFEEAYPCFHDIKVDDHRISFKSIRAYFLCLKELNKVEEARKAYERVPEPMRGFYGECSRWLSSLSKVNPSRRTRERIIGVTSANFVEEKQNKHIADDLVKPSENSLSLLRGKFSSARTEGIDPLYRKKPKEIAQEIALKCLIEPYPQEFIASLDEAVRVLYELRACLVQTLPSIEQIKYHVIQFLSVLHRDSNAIPILSARVINFECLRHSFSLISKYPFLCSLRQIRFFAEECILLTRPLADSKTRYANIADFNESPIEEPNKFEQAPRTTKIEFLLKYIREQLVFLKDCQFDCLDFNEDKQSKAVVLTLWQIRSAIRLMFTLDVDKAHSLRQLFPEFLAPFKANCYEQPDLDGVNFEMAAYVYLSARNRIEAVDKLKI